MNKRQIRKELNAHIKTGLTIAQAASALIHEFEMYSVEINEVALDMETKELLKAAGL